MKEVKLPLQLQQKLEQAQKRKESTQVDEEWLFIAKFGRHYGYRGIEAILNNEISLETAIVLLEAGEKIHASEVIDHAVATQVANASVNAKKGQAQTVFKKGMRHFIKKAEL